jgi:hypothetical protein
VPALAVASLFAQQGRSAVTAGTMPTETVLFGILIIGTALTSLFAGNSPDRSTSGSWWHNLFQTQTFLSAQFAWLLSWPRPGKEI